MSVGRAAKALRNRHGHSFDGSECLCRSSCATRAQMCLCKEPAERFCPLLHHENPQKNARKKGSCSSPLEIPLFLYF